MKQADVTDIIRAIVLIDNRLIISILNLGFNHHNASYIYSIIERNFT